MNKKRCYFYVSLFSFLNLRSSALLHYRFYQYPAHTATHCYLIVFCTGKPVLLLLPVIHLYSISLLPAPAPVSHTVFVCSPLQTTLSFTYSPLSLPVTAFGVLVHSRESLVWVCFLSWIIFPLFPILMLVLEFVTCLLILRGNKTDSRVRRPDVLCTCFLSVCWHIWQSR